MSPMSAVLCLVATTVLGPGAIAQPGSPVYPDDSPAASAGLVAVDRLLASGNADEAVRTLQALLADEGDRVVAVADDENLFVGVRGAVHDRLLARPELLQRYREIYSPQAQALLDTGRIEDLERVYLLTPAGFEAALRLAQQQLESARFNAALITLNQLDAHPDRTGEAGRGAARLAAQLARYLPRPEVVELATRWGADSDAGALDLQPYERPAKADRKTFTPMTTGEALDGDAIPPAPMWTVPLEGDDSIRVRRPARRTARERRPGLWTYPTIAGQVLLVNDTVWIRAWDRYTLEPLWRVKPGANGQGTAQLLGEAWQERTSDTVGHIQIEDSSTVSVWGDVVVAVTGFAKDGLRFGDARVHGLDLRTGATRWSVSPGAGDGSRDYGTARGPVMVDEGMAVVSIRRSARTRRVVSFLLMGIDALSGEVRWVRPVGSAGALPFANDRRVSNSPVLDRGVVYASDQIGVVAAVEAETGRSIWVRRLGAAQIATGSRTSAWESIAPVVHDDAVVMLTPARDRIVMLDRHTGALIASRTADRFGLPQYLVGAGEHLAAVGERTVATVRFDEFESGLIRVTRKFDQPGIQGRVVPAGGNLYVPTPGGLVKIDPADPRESTRSIALDHPGEALPVGEQVVVVDDTAVHTYVSWAVADRVLQERMQAEPDQAAPAVSYADLAYRVGRTDRIVPAVDRALEALDRRPSGASNIAARSRLFETLHTMATEAMKSNGGESPVLDEATLRAVVDRLGRVAATSEQRVQYLLVLGPALESTGEHSAASEAYGRILADAALGDVELVIGGRRDEARSIATLRLRALALEHGVEAYAGENVHAAAALEELGQGADPAAFEALARRYPVSESAARAWLSSGEAQLGAEHVGGALLAFRRSLLAAEIALAAGLTADIGAVAAAADRIVATLRDQERYAEAAQILARLIAEYPDSPILAANADALAVLQDLNGLAVTTDRGPRIGSTLTGSAQAIAGWTLLPALMDGREGGVGHVLLRSTTAREIALFGPVEAVRGLGERAMNADGPGRLAKLWSRTFTDFDPSVVRVDDDSVYLLWPTPRGGEVERISVIDGRTLWRTGAFDSLFKPDGSFANRLTNRLRLPIMFDTPSGVRRAAAELVVWVGPNAVVVVERSGRMAVFDPATGTVVRATMTPVAAVFDVHVAGGRVALAGSKSPPNPDTGRVDLDPIVALFDARTGQRVETSPVVSAQPAWVRLADPDTLVLGTSDGLQCVEIPTGRTRWSRIGDVPAAATDGTMAAWVFGDVLYTLGRSGEIVARSMSDGRVIGNGPLVGNGRFGRWDLRTVRAGDRAVFVGGGGVVVADAHGKVVGMDPLDAMRRAGILRPAIAQGRIVAVERATTVDAQGRGVNRVHMLASETGELLGSRDVALTDPPSRVGVLEGRVLISTASMTIVYDTSEH